MAAGRNTDRIWKELKGQCILGKEEFADALVNYVRGYLDIKEIPRSQRYIVRPKLELLFSKDVKDRKDGVRARINDAIEKYGYSQKEVADYLKVHYCTVSRVINSRMRNARCKT